MKRRGNLIVISGPSGVGKGTVCEKLMQLRDDIELSISATTRKKRDYEVDGENYHFFTKDQFDKFIDEGRLLEYAQVHGNYYGTPRDFVEERLNQGHDVILEIDVQGAMQVKRNIGGGIFIFLLPPKVKDLESRIRHRGTETESDIKIRLKTAEKEFSLIHDYDYAVVNDIVDNCVDTISKIIDSERYKVNSDVIKEYWRQLYD